MSVETERTSKSALSRLSFLVKDDVQDHVKGALNYHGAATKKFLSGGWRIKYGARAGIFKAVIFPLRKSAEILARHVERTRITAQDAADLTYKGRIAIPLQRRLKRGARGKVPQNLRPTELLQRNAKGQNRGFIVGDTIVQRLKGKKRTEPVFALEDSTVNTQRLYVQKVAERSVTRRAGEAFADAIRRAMRRAGAT